MTNAVEPTSDAAAEPWRERLLAWLAVMDEHAPGAIEGLYLVGSIALSDWQADSDIDIVAVTAEPADEELSGTLRTALTLASTHVPDARIDGPFLAWGDLTVAPVGVSRPWTLDGVFHHDAECFELNPVTWYTLARYGVTIRGPRPDGIGIPLDTVERIRFVRDNANGYWAGVLTSLRGAISELAPDGTLTSEVAEWCVLGPARMLYTATTGDVASKSAAGQWCGDLLGEPDKAVLDTVVDMRSGPEQPVDATFLRDCADTMSEILRRTRTIVV